MPAKAMTDATTLKRVIETFRDALAAHREVINRLNVYPVPDGDTGTNMSLTMRSVGEELEGVDDTLDAVCKAVAHGSLMGARGNSGVILSQILRGLVGSIQGQTVIDGPAMATALTAAAEGAYGAVGNPVEGTILTVIREAAEAATATAASTDSLSEVLEAARAQGEDALARTPDMLPVLKDAGVVDSGGTGLLLLFDAALHVIDGRPMPEVPEDTGPLDFSDLDQAPSSGDTSLADLRYEVMYFLDAPDDTISSFKSAWAEIGDSIVVVGGEGIWNCHIHTDDIGGAIEAGIEVGKPSKIRVTDLLDELAEIEEQSWVRDVIGDPEPPAQHVPTAVVAVGVGSGVAAILRSLGAQHVVTGGQSMNPSTADLVAAVEGVNADEVVILPNNKNIIPVAEQVDAQTERSVTVVPTRGIAEALAALMVYDPQAPADGNASTMTSASADVATGEVTQAVRASTSDAGAIAEGDWLGIRREGICAIAPTMPAAATGLLAELIDDHELLTIIAGEGADEESTAAIQEWLATNHPDMEIEVHEGGQPLYPYYFGLE